MRRNGGMRILDEWVTGLVTIEIKLHSYLLDAGCSDSSIREAEVPRHVQQNYGIRLSLCRFGDPIRPWTLETSAADIIHPRNSRADRGAVSSSSLAN